MDYSCWSKHETSVHVGHVFTKCRQQQTVDIANVKLIMLFITLFYLSKISYKLKQSFVACLP
jgi:hypothetical protein